MREDKIVWITDRSVKDVFMHLPYLLGEVANIEIVFVLVRCRT